MTTVPDISVVQLPPLGDGGSSAESPPVTPTSIWAGGATTQGRRWSPLTLAILGVGAGIAAMVLGAGAVISAGTSGKTPSSDNETRTSPVAVSTVPGVERRVLALLAKPSTERIAFRGGRGLVLAVGSGGRAAILVRGLARASVGKPYVAWVVTPGAAPMRAGQFVGTERAVFLAGRIGPHASVVVSTDRPLAGPAARNPVVALRG